MSCRRATEMDARWTMCDVVECFGKREGFMMYFFLFLAQFIDVTLLFIQMLVLQK